MALEIAGLVKRFGDNVVVDGVSLAIESGEIVALLGPSGCGKTTTLRMVAGFETPDAGSIALEGEGLVGLPAYRRGIGLVFQDYALFPHMTVEDNIGYGLKRRGVPRGERRERVAELLRLVRLEGLGARRPIALSGGQQQRVALARALAIRPRLLLLDEPLSNLDAKLREDLRSELRDLLVSLKITTLLVTHDQIEAMAIADRIAVMGKGSIAQIGIPREIYESPATRFVADFVGRSLWFEGEFKPGSGALPARFETKEGYSFEVAPPIRTASSYGLSIRPEHMHIVPRVDDANRLTARVERIEFNGAEIVVHGRLDRTGRRISLPIRVEETAIPTAGEAIEIGFARDRARIVAAD